MSDDVLTLTEVDGMELERQARERGYESAVAYLRALVAADALVEALRDDWQDADESPEVLEAEFRQAWHDAMTGNTRPIEELWDALDDEINLTQVSMAH